MIQLFSRTQIRGLVAGSIFLLAGCSGGGGSTPTSPSPGTGTVATIIITANGVDQKAVTINVGEVVVFVNNDSRRHEIASNPHPVHTDCPPINALGILAPGQTGRTANFTTARTCGFHDHDLDTNTSLQGTITIR